jgi:hypothetical protein
MVEGPYHSSESSKFSSGISEARRWPDGEAGDRDLLLWCVCWVWADWAATSALPAAAADDAMAWAVARA